MQLLFRSRWPGQMDHLVHCLGSQSRLNWLVIQKWQSTKVWAKCLTCAVLELTSKILILKRSRSLTRFPWDYNHFSTFEEPARPDSVDAANWEGNRAIEEQEEANWGRLLKVGHPNLRCHILPHKLALVLSEGRMLQPKLGRVPIFIQVALWHWH